MPHTTVETHQVRELVIEAIVEDARFQLRARGSHPRLIKEYAQKLKAGYTLPPITVAHVGNAFVLVDGFHRLAAAKIAGFDSILAVVVETDEAGAQRESFQANVSHGLRLSTADKKHRVDAYFQAGLHLRADGSIKSPYLISEELGGVPTARTIYNYQKKHGLTSSIQGRIPQPWRIETIPESELLDDLDLAVRNIKATCERLENRVAIGRAARELRTLTKWLARREREVRSSSLEINI